jgi:hypothetical protein
MKDFEDYLMEKYPDLFPKDGEGNVTYSSCGIGGYECWEPIIDAACQNIDAYCKRSYKSVKTKKISPRIKGFVYYKLVSKVYRRLFRILDPYNGIIPKELRKSKTSYVVKPEWTEKAKSRKRYKWQLSLNKLYYSLSPTDLYERVYPSKVTLGQLKAKFDQCCWYVSGGDEYVRSVVSFTQYLCDQITEGKLDIKKP